MTTLPDQLRLEEDMILQGADRYMAQVKNVQTKERASETGYANILMKKMVKPVSEAIASIGSTGATKGGKFKKLIKDIDPDLVAYLGLKTVLNSLHSQPTSTVVCLNIGQALEDELRFANFREMHPRYYEALLADFNRRGTKSYRHLRNALSITSSKKGMEWEGWPKEVRLNVGALILNAISKSTDILEIRLHKKRGGKPAYHVIPTPEAIQWISGYNQHASLLHPVTKPCIIAPDAWSGFGQGGYWSEQMRYRSPFVTGLRPGGKEFVQAHDLGRCFAAVNAIQDTKWVINTRVLDVLTECWDKDIAVGLPSKQPIFIPQFKDPRKPKDMDPDTFSEFLQWKAEVSKLYTADLKRGSKAFDIARVIKMAKMYAEYPTIWFVHHCDFRGRVYASSTGLSPQGPDHTRALLAFYEEKELGKSGVYWLAVHGANCYGVDKVSFEDRVRWTYDQWDAILATAKDPIENRSFWSSADSPWQFLAFCFEFAEVLNASDPTKVKSRLPVSMDGTCNGLQNFSALLRDEVGGAATNLVPGDTPADIYTEVATKALEAIKAGPASPEKTFWIAFAEAQGGKLPRSIAKRPVMTLPYGSTKYSCLDFIQTAVYEIDPDFIDSSGQLITFLTDHIWEAIGSTVTAARATMDWLQEVAGVLAKNNLPVWWVSPVGFPVYQKRNKDLTKRINTSLCGNFKLNLTVEGTVVSSQKQKQGVAPNFVHSLDAAHLMSTVLAAKEEGINSFAMVHDSYATHAADTEVMRALIRDSFVDLYLNNDPLKDLLAGCALSLPETSFPPIPKTGTLDLEATRESAYMFG